MNSRRTSRRELLKKTGVAGVAGLGASMAGCLGDDDDPDDDDDDVDPGDDDPVELGDPVPPIGFVAQTEGSNADRHELSLIVVENMRELGLEIEENYLDFETQVSVALVEHDFDVNVIGWGGTPERIDPHVFISDLHEGTESNVGPGGRNSPGYDNPAYNEIASRQFLEVDLDTRQELIHEAQEILARDQPRTYISTEDDVHAYRPDNFTDIVPTMGEGLNSFWNMISATPLGDRDTLRFGMSTEVTSLNPMQDLATPDRQWVRLIYDRLYRITDEGIPEPWAAADDATFEDDGETVIVPIRDDMTFHDGEPIDAETVKWSMDFFDEHSITYGDLLNEVEEVEVTGEYEVTFHLAQPFATFVANVLGAVYIFPPHIWEDIDDPVDEDDEDFIGSGPFEFDEWILEQELRLTAFEDHFSAPNADRLIRVRGADFATVAGMLEEDAIDMYGITPSVTARDRLEDDPNIENVFSPSIAFHKYAYNMRREHMQDVYLRRALAHCIPKDVYVDDIRGGAGTVIHSPIAPINEFWHNPDVEEFNFDLEAAREELRAGGYDWDDDGRLHYTADFETTMFLE